VVGAPAFDPIRTWERWKESLHFDFAALMIGHHFSISDLWKAPSAAGVCRSRRGAHVFGPAKFRLLNPSNRNHATKNGRWIAFLLHHPITNRPIFLRHRFTSSLITI
jgi:hypothetical protein